MRTKDQVIKFVRYLEMQLRVCEKSDAFILDKYINNVLSCTKGYEDYFIVTQDYPNVGLFKYSEVFKSE